MSLVDTNTGEIVARSLEENEAIIERGLATFIEVGNALAEIRDNRLYRESHGTFEGYCRDRWGWNRNYANKVISAADVGTNVPIDNEGQARALSPLRDDPDAMTAAYQAAQAKAAAEDARLTASRIKAEVDKILADEQAEADAEGVFEAPENRTSEPSETPRLCTDCGAELDWRRGPDDMPEWFCAECEPPAPLTEVPPASDEVSTSDVVTFLPATWRNYPPLTRTAEGKQLANWLDSKSIKGTDTSEVVAEQAAKCPPDAAQKLREHAEVQAAMWQEFADRLTHIRPTLGVVK